MQNRECGSCTACCEGWIGSEVIDMGIDKPCQHCTAQGCAIYESRPVDPCQVFKCAWLKEDSPLPDDMRPDKSLAIVILDQKWRGHRIISAAPT